MPPSWARPLSRWPAPGPMAKSRVGSTRCIRNCGRLRASTQPTLPAWPRLQRLCSIPHVPLQLVIISVQVFAGLILPSAIIFLQLLLNDHELLGDRWVNRPWNNLINWTIIVVLFALSLLLAAQVMLPKLFD